MTDAKRSTRAPKYAGCKVDRIARMERAEAATVRAPHADGPSGKPGRDFAAALRWLRAGHAIARLAWIDGVSRGECSVFAVWVGDSPCGRILDACHSDGSREPYTFSAHDVLACDWYQVGDAAIYAVMRGAL